MTPGSPAKPSIKTVAVLGAGTMGARIAAHLANAGLNCWLLDMVPSELTPDEKARGFTLTDPPILTPAACEGTTNPEVRGRKGPDDRPCVRRGDGAPA